ncbi:hypothetical protein Taro_005771 [Colocasia esculenta]|uniref:Uncharacterized protein n=1 Tax=Colocasia esculenta TaxID=4460 RepID=A0A843TYT4_COLES|nr:hypothetical protein [Colocasia esculenta]
MKLSLGSPKKPPKHHSFGRRGLGYPEGVMGWPDNCWGHLPNGWACLPPEFRGLQRMQVRDINVHIHGR